MNDSATRLIAFYLPQFHPTSENDGWWGKGFTEWTNVAKATPLFPGHYQPRLPADLGFYDLRLPEVRQAQADLARAHGVSGFCYYHYWFGGRRLLHRPFDEVLASGQPDFPFCLCWANENWTRTWDGLDEQVLVEQRYSPEDDIDHIRWLCRAFGDRRYIRVEGKPLFLIYRATKLPDCRATTATWREEAQRLGVGELFLCRVESFPDECTPPAELGFDAAVEFQPRWADLGTPLCKENHWHSERGLSHDVYRVNDVYHYPSVVEQMLARTQPAYRRFPCVTPAWDNTPRRRAECIILRDSTPQAYERWLRGALVGSRTTSDKEAIVFINAWNEWGEGNYLEPDARHGLGYLEATRRALTEELAATAPVSISTDTAPSPSPPPSAGAGTVSVVMATYNGSAFVAEALESVFAQTVLPSDIIVVDDASTDNTCAIVEAVKARAPAPFQLIRLERNSGGPAHPLNVGISAAGGEYIAILDQDDVFLPHKIELQAAFLRKEPSAGFVFARCANYENPAKVISFGAEEEDLAALVGPSQERAIIDGDKSLRLLLCHGNYVFGYPGFMFRRSLWTRKGGLDVKLSSASDYEFLCWLCGEADVGFIPQTLHQRRHHPANMLHDLATTLTEVNEVKIRVLLRRSSLRQATEFQGVLMDGIAAIGDPNFAVRCLAELWATRHIREEWKKTQARLEKTEEELRLLNQKVMAVTHSRAYRLARPVLRLFYSKLDTRFKSADGKSKS